MNVHFMSKTDEWATPNDFFARVQKEFNLNLDVCADESNYKIIPYYSKLTDGLSSSWKGFRCWMNPPYGRQIGKWIEKAANGDAEVVVCLLPARTDTRWFHDYIYGKAEIRFIKGRLKFGGSKHPAPFPSMLVIFEK